MKDEKKTKKQLIEELRKLRRRLARCEASKSKGKRPQEASLESEKSFRALAANANDGILIADEKGRYVYANKRASRMTGYSLTELLKMGMKDLTHPDEVQKVTERFRKRLSRRSVKRQYETIIVRKDGKSVPIELTAARTVWHGQPGGLAIIRDITERKRTEALLRKSEEKYRALVEPSLQGIVILQGIPPRVVFVNPSAAHILGLTVNELLSLSKRQIFAQVKLPPKEQKNLLQRYLERLEGVPAPTSQEFCIDRANGTTKYVEVFAKGIEFDGKPAVQVVLIDITERKQAEEALQESEERYRALFDRSLYCVYIHDFEGRFLDANKATLKLLGYQKKDIPFLKFTSLLDEDQVPRAKKILKEIKRSGFQKKPSIYKLSRKDGNSVWVETEASVMYRQGKPYAIQGFARDITEKKWTEEILRESEERFRLAFEGGPLGMALVGRNFKLLKVNKTFCRLLGYTESEMSKLTFVDITHPEDIDKDVQLAKQVFGGKMASYKIEKRYIKKNGEILWANLTATVIRSQTGKVLYGLAMIEDVTERKRAEQALRESELRYRTTINSIDDVIHVVDNDLRLILINPAFKKWAKMLKLGTDVVGRTLFEAFPFLSSKIRNEYRRVFRTGQPLITEERTEIEGQEYITETRKIPILDGEEVVRVLTVIRDFTEQRRAEEALRESEEQYRSLVEESLQGLVITKGIPPRILFINPRAAEILGHTVDELSALSPEKLLKLVHIEDRHIFAARMRAREKGESLRNNFEFRVVRKDRYVRWVEIFSTNILYRGEPAVQTAILDITERKEAERELREREEYYSHLIENLTDIIVVVEKDGTIRYISPAVKELFGHEPYDFIDTSIFEHLHPEDVARVEAFFNEAIKTPGITPTVEHRIRREDGSWAYLESLGNNLFDNPVVESMIVISRDITERKRTEEELKKYREHLEELVDKRTAELQKANEQLKLEIEERKRAEEALTEAKTQLEYLLSSSPAVLYTAKAMGDYATTFISENVRMQTGHKPRNFVGDPKFWVKHIHPEDRSRVLDGLEDVLKKDQYTHEYRFLHRDGSYRWMRDELKVTYDASGKPEIIGYWIDITERKKAEEALRQSEERERALLNATTDSALLLDLEANILAINKVAAERLGKSVDDLVGTCALDLFPPDLAKSRKARIKEIVHSKKPIRYEDEREGMIFDNSNYPVFDSKGKVIQLAVFARDITERKQAVEALRESERKYRELTDLLPQTVFELDLKGKLTFSNRCGFETFGYTQKDIDKGLNVQQLLVPEEKKRLLKNIEKRLRGESFEDHEYTALSKEGRKSPVLIYSAPIIRDNKPVGLRGIVLDITERKRSEEKLRAERDKLDLITRNIGVGLATISKDYRTLWANKVLKEIFGDVEGKTCYTTYNQRTDVCPGCGVKKVFMTGKPSVVHEQVGKDAEGNTIWSQIIATPIKDEKGHITAAHEVVVPITERKRMELTQRALQQIANAVHTTEDLDELFAAIHQELGTILNTENFFIALLDRDSDTISFPYHKDERDPYVETLPIRKTLTGFVIRKGQPLLATRKEIERLVETGVIELLGVVPEIWLGVPMRVRNKKIGALVVQNYEDATAIDESDLDILKFVSGQVGLSIEHKRAEEQLKQTLEELARSNAELEQFAHIASHDLQEPLQAVAMSIDIVAKRHRGKFDATADKFIKYAVDESNRMQMLVQDLLTYSRVGRGSMEFKPTDCLVVLDQTLDNLLVPIEQSDAQITHGLLPTVMGDPLQLTQVFQNLVDNAIKFRREEPPRIHVSAKRKGDEWVFSVRDNGMGFDAKHAEKIFVAFERLLDKTKYLGTGIGLAICRKIVERHGGRIWAESIPGEGSKFYFTLPARKGTAN